ncbi:hypothetical protein EJP617_18370 [Erwinia sp. Ejp617]|nr:hypothetical protein EJP617_18370 [Erwinia sp. Ejp617]
MSVAEIQSEIYSAENGVIAIDEKWLRQMLFNAENEIELLTFTVDDEQLTSSVTPIVQNIMNAIS